ncbi:MOSC domain-containing protein [Nocardioides bigeumensis]|uniref:MOSC domain-containing protein n=1 Tax=Nocardioides bigeumensis TaxID=433657 RepID=A0ABN2XJY8_9ACTN
MAHVLSVNAGRPEPNPDRPTKQTGIGKLPVPYAFVRAPGPKRGGLGSGVEGDFIGSRKHHGGDSQAVYAFAREELDWWGEQLGRRLPDGMFGENLTTSGLPVDDGLIGEQWSVGDEVVLEVTGPRVPCATFRHHMAERGWVRRFTERGLTGAYLAVVTPGTVRPDDAIVVLGRPDHDVTLPLAFRAFMGEVDAAERVLAARCLPAHEEDWLRGRLRRRTRGA